MTTELVWSTVKPTFPEVKGKLIIIHLKTEIFGDIYPAYRLTNEGKFNELFDRDFVHYAIVALADLTAPVSPLPLWGREPVMNKEIVSGHSYWLSWGESSNKTWFIETPPYSTEAEAILAWNRIAEALNEVER